MELNFKGSPKQIAWAKDIIAAAQQHIDNAIARAELYYPDVDCALEAAEMGQEALNRFIEKTVSASEIIDKRDYLYGFDKSISSKRKQLTAAKEKAAEAEKAEKKAALEAKKAEIRAAEDAKSEEQKAQESSEEDARLDALQNRIDAPDTENEIAFVRSLFANINAKSDKQLAYAQSLVDSYLVPVMEGKSSPLVRAIRILRELENGSFDKELEEMKLNHTEYTEKSRLADIYDLLYDWRCLESIAMIANRASAGKIIDSTKYNSTRDTAYTDLIASGFELPAEPEVQSEATEIATPETKETETEETETEETETKTEAEVKDPAETATGSEIAVGNHVTAKESSPEPSSATQKRTKTPSSSEVT